MNRTIERYPFTVRPLSKEDGGGYLCEFADIPGVMGDGKSVEAAIVDARKALKAALLTLKHMGRSAPVPTTASGQWRMRAPRSLHQRLAARAKAEGVSLNTLAVTLLSEGLGRRVEKDAA
jgi:antitoxin HicB